MKLDGYTPKNENGRTCKGWSEQQDRIISLRVRLLSVGIMSLLLFLSVLAPLFAPDGITLFYDIFSPVCHQEASRCLTINGYPLALCARCTALYAGIGIGAIFLPTRHSLFAVNYLALFIIALCLVCIDILLEQIGVYENMFELRMATGFLLGITIAPFLNTALQDFFP